MIHRAISAMTVAVLAAFPAWGQQVTPPGSPAPGGQGARQICSSGGVTYLVGEYACLPACHGARRLAVCEVNVTTQEPLWTYVSDACPSALLLNPPWPNDWTELPASAAMTPLPVVVNLSAISPEIAPKIGSRWH